ncbi:MAG: rhomboid family intramembrane serine protease [Jatrophihabitans sp.]|uniref:rhomboid family intramembrane serine protease n=1 Tax=Jatrophihabitans sp. TaxID=1932789 RepID=UPI003F7EAB89
MDGPSADAGVLHCYRHPDRETMIRCTRCERPICPECMHPAAVGFHCPDDVAQGRRTVRRERTSVGALLRQSPPYVTVTLIVANAVVFVVTAAMSHTAFRHPELSTLFADWLLQPQAVHSQNEYYRLVTSGFLHVSLLHIAANMLALFFLGPALERLLGPVRFAAVYLLGLLGGSAAIYAFGDPITTVAGASGAVFALFGASLVLVRRLGLDPQWLIGIIVLNFVVTFSVADISKLGHLGGFVAGVVSALVIGGLPNRPRRWSGGRQATGLLGVGLLVVLVVAVRSLTW